MIYVPRSYMVEHNRVILYRWKAYRNHSKAHLMPRYVRSVYVKLKILQHLVGWVWVTMGR